MLYLFCFEGNILDRLTAEREAAERREKEARDLQREYYKLKEQHDELKEKMRFFTKVGTSAETVIGQRFRYGNAIIDRLQK